MPDAVSQAHSSRHLIRRCLPDAAALGVWTAAIVLFFWPVLSGRRVFFYFDVTELNYPYRAFFGNALREGRFPPLWCPHLYCGFPLFAESQTGYLYPLKYLLYPWMPPWLAFGYDTVLSIWLAGVAMYAYLRRRVRPAAALAGAVPFGYGGFMAAHLIHTSYVNSMMWIPLALLAMERAWESGRVKYVVYAAVCLAMQILAGNMQIAILTYLALAVMAAYWIMVAVAGRRNAGEASSTKADGRRAALAVSATTAAACVLATALGAVQILPAKRLLDQSPRRGGLNFDELTGQSSWHPELLPTLFLPNAFGSRSHNTDWLDGYYWYHEMYVYLGVTTLLLALIGGTGWRNRWVFGHIVLTAVCVLLMLGKYTFLYNFFPYVPILRGMRAPVRESVWLGLSVGALAAMGVERLCRGEGIRLRAPLWTFAGLAGAALLLVVGAYSPYLMGDLRATRAADLPTSFPWEPNAFREQRLIRQITTDAAAATLLALATLLMVWRLARGQRAGQAASMQANSPSPAISSRRADSPNPPPQPSPTKGEGVIFGRLLSVLLPMVVMLDVFWAARQAAPTANPSYWSKPPAAVSLVRDRGEQWHHALDRPRIHTMDHLFHGLHQAPGYAVPLRQIAGPAPMAGQSISMAPPGKKAWETAVQHLPLSVPAAWAIDSATGHTPIRPSRVDRFLSLIPHPANPLRFRDWPLDVAGVSHLVFPIGASGQMLGLPSLGWIQICGTAAEGVFHAGMLAPPSAQIYRNTDVLPRARLMGRVVYAANEKRAERLLREGGFDPREVLVVEDALLGRESDSAQREGRSPSVKRLDPGLLGDPGTAKIVSYEAERVVIDAGVRARCYLFLADTYDPEWEATVDGDPAAIRPAQLAFRAVLLQPGRHRVEFRYTRCSFYQGLWISAAASAFAVTLLLLARRWRLPALVLDADVPLPDRFRWGLVLLVGLVLLPSLVTQQQHWALRVDEDGRWIGSFHSYHWERPLP